MELLVVRHGKAEDRTEWARAHADDATRPLTDEGVKKMKQVAKGLREVVPEINVLATSPLVRAVETARLVAAAYDNLKPEIVEALSPGIRPDALTAWLEPHSRRSTVAIVGHEPTLSIAVAWLTGGGTKPFLELKTGGVCCLEFDGSIAPGAATLRWAMTPKQLRALGD